MTRQRTSSDDDARGTRRRHAAGAGRIAFDRTLTRVCIGEEVLFSKTERQIGRPAFGSIFGNAGLERRRGMARGALEQWRMLALGMLSLLWVSPGEAQVDCTALLPTECSMANDQYMLLQKFQELPGTQSGQNALKADLAAVVSIYNDATVAQRAQAVQNSQSVVSSWNGNADSYNPTAQYNVWQQISSGSRILSSLGAFPQLTTSSALADVLSGMLARDVEYWSSGQTTSPTISALTQLLQGYYTMPPGSTAPTFVGGGSIAGVQMVSPLKDAFTAYSIYYPYSNPANTTPYSLPPCGTQPCQPDPRPYQLSSEISLWQPGQASASDMSSQSGQWIVNQTSGAFPSGHSTYGNTTALLHAILFPQAYQSLMVSGQQFGLSRNILGVHHTLDIIGGRMLAYYTMTQLLSGNYVLSAADVPTFHGVPAYSDFQTYVSQLASILQGQIGSAAAVPYAACAANVASCMTSGVIPTTAQFAVANQAYEAQATYGLPPVGATNMPGVVPANAELLLTTRFPYLGHDQIREVLRTTELPSGGPLDDGTGWARLNLFKAAGGYGAFDSNVTVNLDASLGGFNAVDMWSNDITGPGGLTKRGSGLLILGGTNSYGGGTTVIEGTVALSGSMTGNLDIRAGASFVSSGGYAVAAGDSLTNDGTFQSVNSSLVNNGTVENRGDILGGVTNRGVFRQLAGRFENGPGSTFTNNATFIGDITNSGYLGGSGTFTGSVVNNGTISPGNSIGTLTVNGSYAQAAGSSYAVETNSLGQADRLNVGGAPGTATIAAGTGVFVAPDASSPYSPRTRYTVLNATGGVTGTYSTVASALPFLLPSLSYDANNVYLTLQVGGFARQAQTSNQAAVGAVLDAGAIGATGDFATVLGAFSTMNAQQGVAAMNAISGQNYSAFSSAGIATTQVFMTNFANTVGGTSGGGKRVALAEACDVACDTTALARWGAWGGALGGFGVVGGNANAGTLTYSLGGFAAGIDRRVTDELLVGVTAGFTSGTQWVGGFSGRGISDTFQAGLYASYAKDAVYVDGLAAYAYSDNRMQRQITIPGLSRIANGRTGANLFFGQVEAGYRFEIGGLAEAYVTPFARLQAATATQNAFTESGAGALDLSIAAQTTNSLRSVLGAQLGGSMDLGWREKLAMQFKLGWGHEYADTGRPVTASFVGAPALPFTTYGAAPQRDSVVLGLSASTAIADTTSAYFRYEGDVSSEDSSHALTAGFRMTW
ncbi:MAG: autotransporter domain-containing protein [Reyranella sp.]